jgi:uncharacterized membrane protein (UPF0127 family)
MRTERIKIGDRGQHTLTAMVCETFAERKNGLQGVTLKPGECMVFPFPVRRTAIPMHMASVAYPIDIAWIDGGKIAKVVTISPGDTAVYTTGGDTVIEFRGGFLKDLGLGAGSVLSPSMSKTAGTSIDPLRSLTEAELDPEEKKVMARRTAASEIEITALLSRIVGQLDRGAPWDIVRHSIAMADSTLSVGDRDRLARRIDALGYKEAAQRMIRTAQSEARLPITDKDQPGGKLSGPDAHSDAATPDQLPGTGTNQPLPGWDQTLGRDPTKEEMGQGTRTGQKVKAKGEIHPGDRVRAKNDVDGMSKDDQGTCTAVQNDALQIVFDGEPVPRWISRDLLMLDKSMDDALKEIEGEDAPGPGGPGAPKDPAGGGGGGLADLLSSLGG